MTRKGLGNRFTNQPTTKVDKKIVKPKSNCRIRTKKRRARKLILVYHRRLALFQDFKT